MRVRASTVQELINALLQSNVSEIDLDANKVYTVSSAYSGLNAFPPITDQRSLTIYGNNATIERDPTPGTPNFRFFYLNNASLELNGLTLRGGRLNTMTSGTTQGAAIFAQQPQSGPIVYETFLSVQACTFESNEAVFVAPSYGKGGAIKFEGRLSDLGDACTGRVFICNSTFRQNSAYNGGAIEIFDSRNTMVQGTRFESNVADLRGGAIIAVGGPTEYFKITDCQFFNNEAGWRGGAIENMGCKMPISDSIFAVNTAEIGGALSKTPTFQLLSLHNCSIFGNISSGSGADVQADPPPPSPVTSIEAANCWWGASDGPSGGGGGGDSISTYVNYLPILKQNVPEHEGVSYCPVVYTTQDAATSGNPISLRLGEKRLMETDLRLATANGVLDFSRTFRQGLIDQTGPLGLGWVHNHRFFIIPPTGTGDEKRFTAELPDGGIAIFEFLGEKPGNPDVHQYIGAAGSTAKANINTVTEVCKIKTSDRTTYIFQYFSALGLFFLTQRITANGEKWTYLYSASPEKLRAVVDDFGCRLEFSYYDTSDFRDGLLSRVDASRNGALASSAEFDYVETMENGIPTTSVEPLLAEVKDVRGNIWTYAYYGSTSGEDGDPNPLNFFKKRVSPEIISLDNETIELETLTYTTSGIGTTIDTITQARGDGLLETLFEYHMGTASNQTLETIAASTRRHTFDRDILASTVYPASNPDPNQLAGTGVRETGTTFRPAQQRDANGNATRMVWSERGAFLDFVSDASGATTGFTYEPLQEDDEADLADGGRLQVLTNAVGYKTQYVYDDQVRQPTLILNGSEITETAIKLNDSDTSGSWRKINNSANVTVNEIWDQIGHGYLRRIQTTDDASGIRSQSFDIVNGKTYDVSVIVRTTQGSCDLRIALNGILDADENETVTASDWTVISFSHTASANASTYLTVETTDANGGSFEIYSASVIEDERAEKVDDAFFELPKSASPWSEFGTLAALNQRVAGADAGKKSRRVVTNLADVGIESDAAVTLTAGKKYLWIARIFPVSGIAKMKLSATLGPVIETEAASSKMMRWQTLRAVLNTVSSTQSNVRLQFLSQGAGAEFIVDSVHMIELDNIQSWRDFRYDFIWRTLDENSIEVTDASVFQQLQKSYDVSAARRGLLQSTVQVDSTDSSENRSTTYSYDTAGRQTEVQHSSMLGSCQVSYTVYDEAGNIVASICNYDLSKAPTPTTEPPTDAVSAAALYNPVHPTKNIVTTHEYDEMNRRFSTTQNAGSGYAKTSYSVFDSLNRICLSVSNYVNPNVLSVPTYTPPYTWTWDEFAKVWKDDSTTPQTISHGARLDENIISETVYNERGLVRLQRDVAGHTTLLGYDIANRLIKTIRNASQPEYDNTVAGDVTLAMYPGIGHTLSTVSDEDIISEQVYDPAGNTVIAIQNPDFEDVRIATMNGYDAMNRVVKTINAASDLDYDFETDHALINYVPSGAVDQDIVTETIFDVMGRVEYSIDPAGQRTRTIYDELGRVHFTIQNYVPQMISPEVEADPRLWTWRAVSDVYAWRYSATDPTVVSHGEYNSKNIVTETIYGTQDSSDALIPDARRNQTRDVFGRLSYRIMDGLGRQVKAIVNYVPVGTSDPMDWIWRDDAWHTGPTGSELVNFGTGNDQNLITETIYDTDGRVQATRSADGLVTRNVYDPSGRQVKTIRNYVEQLDGGQSTAPLGWVWRAVGGEYAWRLSDTDDTTVDQGDRGDFNIISATAYDEQNRVFLTRDSRGLATHHVYDDSNRVVMTITNFNAGLADNAPEGWSWRAVGSVFDWYTDGDDPVGHGTENDQNIIAATEEFDLLGRVVLTRDVTGIATLQIYDELGRQNRTVTNYIVQGATDPKNWVWRAESGVWGWYVAASGSTLVSHGAHNDVNLISDTQYDKAGRVLTTRDSLGTSTAYAYDRAGRQVKSIRNYVEQLDGGLPTNPLDWIWRDVDDNKEFAWRLSDTDDTIVDHGDRSDFNIISETAYDEQNRAILTRDSRGLVTRQVYDDSNRVVMTITNFNADLADNMPEGWAWRDVGSVFDWYIDSDDPVGHGTENDQNIIAATEEFDRLGRVILTRDVAGLATLKIYDELGRQIRTVTNYIVQGATEPKDWVWRAESGVWGWYVAASGSTLVSHGTQNDVNLINDTQYDKAGRVILTRDARGTATAYIYDLAGRERNVTTAVGTDLATVSYICFDKSGRAMRRIENWIDNGVSPDTKVDGTWEFAPTTHGIDNDQNLITTYRLDASGRVTQQVSPSGSTTVTIYELDGQPKRLIDPEGIATLHIYDGVRRMRRVVQNYFAQQTRIAFTSNRDRVNKAQNDIYTMSIDGTNVTRLTDEGDNNEVVSWSPDGSKLAFYRGMLAAAIIFTMNSDGTGQTALTNTSDLNWDPTWSPDGLQLIYKSFENGWYALKTMDSDGDNKETLLTFATNREVYQPDWSWANGRVVFWLDHKDASNVSDICVIDSDGSNLEYLVADGRRNRQPVWSPDGTRIAFEAFDFSIPGDVYQLYVMDADGSNITQLTFTAQANTYPTWSPDGQQIMFYSRRDGLPERQPYIMNADGTDQLRITVNTSTDLLPAWSPFQANPAAWEWVTDHWENEEGATIIHGEHNDTNIIVDVRHDLAGRSVEIRNPGGTLADETNAGGGITAHRYDALGRRIVRVLNYTAQGATDPADWVWSTVNDRWERGASDTTPVSHGVNGDENMIMQTRYVDLDAADDITGQTRTITTQPDGTEIVRNFDRLGRALTIGYDDLATTPDVAFAHDTRSNRVRMTETGSGGIVRETLYTHDLARRLSEVDFDTDGDTDIDETVGYAYDLGGLRTLLAMPGDRDVTYSYDARGQIRMLTEWDNQTSQFRYDAVGRHALTLRANGLRSLYRYDAGGRLRLLRHDAGARLFAQFAYKVDERGNRTQAFEAQRHPGIGTTIIDQSDDTVYYHGTWTTASGFHVTDQPYASFQLTFAGNENVELTMGEGPDHGLYDVYIGGSLWQSFSGYAAGSGERVIPIPLSNDGPFTLQVNNRADKSSASSGHVMRFKQLSVDAEYTLNTIKYTYDAASRVLGADYYPGENTASTPVESFAYGYDIAGNLTDNNSTARTFNKLNQISSGGVTYDANGNMTNDGTNASTWDHANRLLSMGGHDYAYDGMGNRISQTVSSVVTRYLLDVQPDLVQVIAATVNSDTERYIHSLRGIHATQDSAAAWRDTLQDGLGSVRGELDAALGTEVTGAYAPYGVPTNVEGAYSQPFRFTGEMRDANALQYHRARNYAPELDTWISLDLIETLNKYAYVDGNPILRTDSTGLQWSRLCRQATQSIPLSAWGIPEVDDSLCVGIDIIENIDDLATGARDFFNRLSSLFTNANPLFASLANQTYFTLENGVIRFPSRSLQAVEGVYLDDTFERQAVCGHYAPGTAGSCGGAIAIPIPGAYATPMAPVQTNVLLNSIDEADCKADIAALVATATGTQTPDEIYYFRGTTVGFLGGQTAQKLGVTSTSTQPPIATIFATVAETMHGGQGIVYFASSSDLAGTEILPPNWLAAVEQEVVFSILPTDFVSLTSGSVSALGARTILSTMGVAIDARITISSQTDMLRALRMLSKSEIQSFVNLARITP